MKEMKNIFIDDNKKYVIYYNVPLKPMRLSPPKSPQEE